MDITHEHKNEFDKKNSLLSDFFMLSEFYKSKEYTAKYWSRCTENRLLKDLYQYIIKRTKPSSSFWECRDQNNLDALGNDTKTNFQKNIPGKVQFQKRSGSCLPHPPTHLLSLLLWGLGRDGLCDLNNVCIQIKNIFLIFTFISNSYK